MDSNYTTVLIKKNTLEKLREAKKYSNTKTYSEVIDRLLDSRDWEIVLGEKVTKEQYFEDDGEER